MKKSLFLPVMVLVIISVFSGCQKEPLCPPSYCYDEWQDMCVPCGGGYYPADTIVVAPPPVVTEQPNWEPVPGHGVIFTHLNSGVVMGMNTMTDEFGQRVFVHISSTVYNRDAGIFYSTWNGQNLGYPILVEYTWALWPITNQPYRSAVRLSFCDLCW
ncbi:MAG: hypothetical protein K9M36_03125 [Candidatus Pacebacteria bacterium]|nr:hypothetical protein [Candidatus Paceibacterota bacterium]